MEVDGRFVLGASEHLDLTSQVHTKELDKESWVESLT